MSVEEEIEPLCQNIIWTQLAENTGRPSYRWTLVGRFPSLLLAGLDLLGLIRLVD